MTGSNLPTDDDLSVRLRLHSRSIVWRPPTDVFETEQAIIVRVEIAGMREEDFSVELTRRRLVVRGVRPDVSEKRAFHRMEIRYGEFATQVDLPAQVAADQVEATYRDGFLQVVLPKIRARQIPLRKQEMDEPDQPTQPEQGE
jgi:HSP20 family protein